MIDFILGDSRPYVVNLSINGEPFAIDPEKDTVKVAIVSTEKKILSASPFAVLSTLPLADWSQSKLIIKLPRSQTSGIKATGKALMEIQVTFNGVSLTEADWDDWTWFIDVNLVKATI